MKAGAAPDRRGDPDRRYEFARSSRDLLRLVGGLILLLLGLVLATIFSDALLGFETDLTRVVRGLPEGLAVIVFGTIRALSVLAALGLVAWLTWRRQWLLLGRLLLAGVLAAGLLVLVDRLIAHAPAAGLLAESPPAWATDISTRLGSGNVAVAVASYLVARPLLTAPYRRLAVRAIALTAVHVLLAGNQLPRTSWPRSPAGSWPRRRCCWRWAALIAGLTATGAPNEQAVPAVLVYRVATFWLPVLPGWLAFTLLTRRDVI